jgi:N-glycosylase/DNA lyase
MHDAYSPERKLQVASVVQDGNLARFELPDPATNVLPGLYWGRHEEVLTPAYWAVRARLHAPRIENMPTAQSLREEVGFCLLGGFSVPVELATVFFHHLRENGVFTAATPSLSRLSALLHDEVILRGRPVRYRFPNQRARRLAEVLERLSEKRFRTQDGLTLRSELMKLPGIGPKTASWIARNWLLTDDVAIIDIHVVRACQLIRLFPRTVRLPRDYGELEARFLALARGLNVRASTLDLVMWSEMRTISPRALAQLT